MRSGRAPPPFPESPPPPVIRKQFRMPRPNRGFGRGESLGNDKVFLRAADHSIEYPGSGGNLLLARRQRKIDRRGENRSEKNMVRRSPLRMESHPRSLRDPSSTCAWESMPGKGSRRAHLPLIAISIPWKDRFSGIANRPHVIRGRKANIKKVHGNRHFPVDTLNPIF